MKLRHPYLDSEGPIAFAHRGGALDSPENTIEAFDESYALGYRWMETDVHLSADGVIVSFHDPDLDRVTDRTGRINTLEWAEIRTAVVGDGGTIPTMLELFERFPDARFNIDAKSGEVLEPLLDLVAEHDFYDRVCVSSFFDNRMIRARRLGGPRLCTSSGAFTAFTRMLPRIGGRQLALGADALQVPPTFQGVPVVTPRYIDAAHTDGLAVHVWTIDEPGEMHRLLDLGVDGIMTDRPQVLKDVFLERGIWTER